MLSSGAFGREQERVQAARETAIAVCSLMPMVPSAPQGETRYGHHADRQSQTKRTEKRDRAQYTALRSQFARSTSRHEGEALTIAGPWLTGSAPPGLPEQLLLEGWWGNTGSRWQCQIIHMQT